MTITRALAGTVLTAAVIAGLPTAASAAETIDVCATGCDATTIAAAVAIAADGDTVLVRENQAVSAAITVNKDITITGTDGVVLTRTGTGLTTFAIGRSGGGVTISNLEMTSATVVGGAFVTVNAAHDVTLARNIVHGPQQGGPMSGWVVNRAWTNNGVSGLTVTGNTFHTLRTGGYVDGGSGVISGNVTYNTKGDYLLDEQADFEFTGNEAGPADLPSEWGIVIFAVNETQYDVQALGAANECLSVVDQATGETYLDADCDGIADTAPASKDGCKKGGWANFNNPSFRNQGQCVSSVASRK